MQYDIYNSRMLRSAYDKLGFVDKVFDVDLVVDFGCADGAITQMIKMFMPEATVVGYDKFQTGQEKEGVLFCNNFDELKKLVENAKRPLLVMNSVVHEILNYEKEPILFLKELFSLNFKYIWIRDLKIWNFGDVDYNLIDTLREKYPEQVKDFEEIYGALDGEWEPRNLLHFLLKFRYKENWEHEVQEDYTLFDKHYLQITEMLEENYNFLIDEDYVLPYVAEINKKEFGIDIETLGWTHFKGLWERY